MSNLDGIGEKPSKIQIGGNHYKDLAIQPAVYCQKNNLNMLESGVVKYVTRHRQKGGIEDLKKAIHCIQLILEIDYPGSEDEYNSI